MGLTLADEDIPNSENVCETSKARETQAETGMEEGETVSWGWRLAKMPGCIPRQVTGS